MPSILFNPSLLQVGQLGTAVTIRLLMVLKLGCRNADWAAYAQDAIPKAGARDYTESKAGVPLASQCIAGPSGGF